MTMQRDERVHTKKLSHQKTHSLHIETRSHEESCWQQNQTKPLIKSFFKFLEDQDCFLEHNGLKKKKQAAHVQAEESFIMHLMMQKNQIPRQFT